MSWVARALPAKRRLRPRLRIKRATCGAEPVWTIAGPPTAAGPSCPPPWSARMPSATSRTADRLGLLARDARLHEPERLASRGRLERQDAKTCGRVADTIGMPASHVGHRQRRRGRARRGSTTMPQSISWSATSIQSAAEPDLGALVGRAVEALGEGAVDVGLLELGLARVDQVDPVGLQPHQRALQRELVVRAHLDPAYDGSASPCPMSKRCTT